MYGTQDSQIVSSDIVVESCYIVITFLLFWNFEVKVFNPAFVMPSFYEQFVFINFYSVV